ncbi:MAG: DEAD/DEAH box helicase [bacterium]|nr:DEAD/DEAH box helicase [bacterium]
MTTTQQPAGFSGLGIAPRLLERLSKLSFTTPTPIQRQAIPVAIQGKDIVGIAQTGTGKTLAFGIPMLQRLNQVKGAGIVILPTRELAIQVDDALRKVAAPFGLRTAVLIGGTSIKPQISAIKKRPHIVIATPGRLNDHLQQRTISLGTTRIVVLDEADRMLDMGFAPQIEKIFRALPRERQTMLFSATMPAKIMKMATRYMQLPIRIEVAPAGTAAERVTQEIFVVPKDAKIRLTEKLLQQYLGSTLVFTRTKYGAKKLTRSLRDAGHTAAEIHSNRSLNQRREALEGFKSGKYRVLIATDIASRGIDVTGIELVLNFDLPTNTEDYVHRIGRTARAGAGGHAISFATPDQRKELDAIENLVQKSLPISKLPDLPPARPGSSYAGSRERGDRDYRSSRGGSGRGRRPQRGRRRR